jgi:hypothetical protein
MAKFLMLVMVSSLQVVGWRCGSVATPHIQRAKPGCRGRGRVEMPVKMYEQVLHFYNEVTLPRRPHDFP